MFFSACSFSSLLLHTATCSTLVAIWTRATRDAAEAHFRLKYASSEPRKGAGKCSGKMIFYILFFSDITFSPQGAPERRNDAAHPAHASWKRRSSPQCKLLYTLFVCVCVALISDFCPHLPHTQAAKEATALQQMVNDLSNVGPRVDKEVEARLVEVRCILFFFFFKNISYNFSHQHSADENIIKAWKSGPHQPIRKHDQGITLFIFFFFFFLVLSNSIVAVTRICNVNSNPRAW